MGGLSLPSCRSAALFGKGRQRGTSPSQCIMEDPEQRCLEDDNLPVLERSASSTPLSFSQRALAMLTGSLMTLPSWMQYIIIGGSSASDGDKYTYVMTLLASVFPILVFLRNAIMNGILIRGMLTFLLILPGALILSMVINITHYSYLDLMTCAVRITALVMFVALITTIEMNVQARRILPMVLLTVSCTFVRICLHRHSGVVLGSVRS
jgi:hypothetical protein